MHLLQNTKLFYVLANLTYVLAMRLSKMFAVSTLQNISLNTQNDLKILINPVVLI